MPTTNVFLQIKTAIDRAPRNSYVAELHLQIIKHSGSMQGVSGKDFCKAVGLKESFGTEFLKMRKISERLIAASLDVEKI